MQRLRYTLLGDGSSDRALIPILTWLLRQYCEVILPTFADLRNLPQPPRKLPERIQQSIKLYPCDLLFVHRDAEREPLDRRTEEIRRAVEESGLQVPPPVAPVVPVRMLEAWLLIDEGALRHAAGNPNGNQPLSLPDVNDLEGLQDPKETLYNLMRDASGLPVRRLKRFDRKLSTRLQQVSAEIKDFRVLRRLVAFRRLEEEIERVAEEKGWARLP